MKTCVYKIKIEMNHHSSQKGIEKMAKRTSKKYDAILEASIRVIAKYGYHRAQVSKIAKEACVADGTIYLYFENKEDLLISIFKEKIGNFIRLAKRKISTAKDAKEQLFHIIALHLGYLEANPLLAVVVQMEIRQSDPHVRKEIGELMQAYLNLIEHVMEQGKVSGIFRADLDVRLARKMIFGTLDDLVTSWVSHQQKYSLHALVKPVYQMFVDGITVKEEE
jgi:TetR/AcrR family transcriptional regulator, fatty acid metabolism regulator protein